MNPLQAGDIKGQLRFTPTLRDAPNPTELPFSFMVFDEPLQLDNVSDTSLGKVTIGESKTIERKLINYGTTKVNYRIKLQVLEESKDEEIPDEDSKPTKGGKKKAADPKKKGKKGKAAKEDKKPLNIIWEMSSANGKLATTQSY